MFEQITLALVFSFLLVFARIGSAIMLLPGIGEITVSPRSRLIFAVGMTLITLPIVQGKLPALPSGVTALILLLAGEILIGIFMGAMARMLLTAMHTTGMIIAFQMGLSAAMMFDPSQETQGSVIGNFLTALTMVLIFVSDLHHIFIAGLIDSYNLFIINTVPPFGDFAFYAMELIGKVFLVAFKISAPHLVVGLIMYMGAGVMARVMPQMQVFFVLIPVQIVVGFVVLMLILTMVMTWYLDYFAENVTEFMFFNN